MKPCPDTFPFPLVALDETASTNQYLSQLCNQLQESVAELTTVTAEFQTAGKGQRGNTWEAEEGKNLLFSFVLYPSFLEARRQFILSQIVSLAIKEELSRWSDEITIKWPNDIYWKDKKICGILIENDLSGHHIRRSIAGIGININQEVFNSDAPNPVSLKQITGKEHDRYEILVRPTASPTRRSPTASARCSPMRLPRATRPRSATSASSPPPTTRTAPARCGSRTRWAASP